MRSTANDDFHINGNESIRLRLSRSPLYVRYRLKTFSAAFQRLLRIATFGKFAGNVAFIAIWSFDDFSLGTQNIISWNEANANALADAIGMRTFISERQAPRFRLKFTKKMNSVLTANATTVKWILQKSKRVE